MSVIISEQEISMFTPLMGNWYLPRRFLHAHRSPVTNTSVTDGAVRPVTDDTKKLKMLKISHHYLFTVKPIAINIRIFLDTNKHTKTLFAYAAVFVVPKYSLRIAPSLPFSVVSRTAARVIVFFCFVLLFRDYYRARDSHRFLVASHSFMYWMGACFSKKKKKKKKKKMRFPAIFCAIFIFFFFWHKSI